MTKGNIFDYLTWRGDINFFERKPNPIDGLIFSALAYLNFSTSDFALKEAYDRLNMVKEEEQYRGLDIVKDNHFLLVKECAKSPRYQNVIIIDYIENTNIENQCQFSATSFLLPGDIIFIAYRGTDSSRRGWKEDLNMAFTSGTPAQLMATEYAKKIAEKYPSYHLYLCGHSKGGNLAVWAAVHLPEKIKQRIIKVYNNDGPGFINDLTESQEYLAISDKILSFVPESSVIGVLMGACDYKTVDSNSVSVMQHDPFSWQISGTNFVYKTERTTIGKATEALLNNIYHSMSPEEIETFANDLYAEFSSNNEKNLSDLKGNVLKHSFKLLNKYNKQKFQEIIEEIKENTKKDD